MTLDQLPHAAHAVVIALDNRGTERRRLMDLGLLPGADVRVDMTSPLGDPTAYVVRGSRIALRRAQARRIHVDLRGDQAYADGESSHTTLSG